jgi:hypothetical protein
LDLDRHTLAVSAAAGTSHHRKWDDSDTSFDDSSCLLGESFAVQDEFTFVHHAKHTPKLDQVKENEEDDTEGGSCNEDFASQSNRSNTYEQEESKIAGS